MDAEELSEAMYPNLKLQIWRSGMRQNHLARSLQVDETTLSRIINGFRKPAPELKAKIAAALGSDQDWLFEEMQAGANGKPIALS